MYPGLLDWRNPGVSIAVVIVVSRCTPASDTTGLVRLV